MPSSLTVSPISWNIHGYTCFPDPSHFHFSASRYLTARLWSFTFLHAWRIARTMGGSGIMSVPWSSLMPFLSSHPSISSLLKKFSHFSSNSAKVSSSWLDEYLTCTTKPRKDRKPNLLNGNVIGRRCRIPFEGVIAQMVLDPLAKLNLCKYLDRFEFYPKEFNPKVHGFYVPWRYYGKPDTLLGDVKLSELSAWIGRRDKTPSAVMQRLGCAISRYRVSYFTARPTAIPLYHVICIGLIYYYVSTGHAERKVSPTAKYH